MKYLLYLLSFIFFTLVSCESKKEKSDESTASADSADVTTAINNDVCPDGKFIKYAHSYNNFIIENQGMILESNLKFTEAIKKEESKEKIAELYAVMEDQAKNSIGAMNKLCAFNGNIEYKNSAAQLFAFYQEAWKDYKPLLDIKNKEDREKVLQDIKIIFNDRHSVTEKKYEDELMKAHTHFANEYKLYVRSTSLHAKIDSMLNIK